MKIEEKHVIGCLIVLVWLLFAVDSALALPWDTPNIYTYWLRDDSHTVNGVLGYVLNVSRSYSSKTVDLSYSGDTVAYWAVRIYSVHGDNSTTELTSSYDLNCSRALNGVGLQNLTWTPDQTVLMIGTEAFEIDLYMKIGAGAWTKKATFVTARVQSDLLHSSTWTIRLWTEREYSPTTTTARFKWGSENYKSRVENIKLAKLDPWETQDHYLQNSDFFQFIAAPWTYYIGDLFWGFGLLFVGVTTYNKYGSIRPVIVMIWLFGGTGGILGMLVPFFSLPLAWFLLSFLLGTTLYLLIR
jgi:hypothetical protein